MDDKKEIQRPIILDIEDAKLEIVQCINGILNRGIPCYIVEMILSDAYTQVKSAATAELDRARAQVETQQNDIEAV
jgi:hypothetical protein